MFDIDLNASIALAPCLSEIIAAQVQNSTFSHWSSSVECGITGYYNPGRLRQASSHHTDLSCHVPNVLFVALCAHNPHLV